MMIYFPILFILMAAFFLFIGVKVVISKKPMFLPSRYFFIFIVLAFSPQFVNTAMLLARGAPESVRMILLLNPLIFICVLTFLWFAMKGYVAIGIHDNSLRDALHYSLNRQNLPFNETLSAVELTSVGARLQVAIQSWIGTGQLKLKKTSDANLLPLIISGINEFYASNDVKANYITAVFYTIFGLLLVIGAVLFAGFIW